MNADTERLGVAGTDSTAAGGLDVAAQSDIAGLTARIESYRAVIRQIHRMYSNTELRWVCERALAEDWDAAVYNYRS